MSRPSRPTDIDILYTNIGRGHPFYLDGVIEALSRDGKIECVHSKTDVFDISRGLVLAAWRLARWLYTQSGSTGVTGTMYRRLRSHGPIDADSFLIRLLGRDLSRHYPHDNPLLVAHPILVAALRGRKNILYQHGELVTPEESVVAGADCVFVPTDEVADLFHQAGYARDQIMVTGLCIEPGLVDSAADACEARQTRMEETDQLTGAFFSSGAEPTPHVIRLVRAICSHVQAGGRTLVFARTGGRLATSVSHKFQGCCTLVTAEDYDSSGSNHSHQLILATFDSRAQENCLVAQMFNQFDFLVAPSHERSNWAMGLGLPMFIVGPAIGPFAPLNRNLMLKAGVGVEIATVRDAETFSTNLEEHRKSGSLLAMSRAGWGRVSIDGFTQVAAHLASL